MTPYMRMAAMKTLLKSFLLAVVAVALISCGRVNQDNFNKVQNNMTSEEVVAILGEPTTSDSINIAGVSGTSSAWKSRDAQIIIQFVNDKVIAKTFTKESDRNEKDENQ